MKDNQIKLVKNYVKELFENDETGHDFYHMKRVAKLAKEIALDEKTDPFICELAAWLHDVGDQKLFEDPADEIERMNDFLTTIHISEDMIKEINEIITNISFRKGNVPNSIEGKIVQDADRLDAIGAIGIARTFAYGGANGQLIHHDERTDTSIQHFHDKLLKLKEGIHTKKAKQIARKRHRFMELYLEQFYNEW